MSYNSSAVSLVFTSGFLEKVLKTPDQTHLKSQNHIDADEDLAYLST